MRCCFGNNRIEFLSYSYEDNIKKVEGYYSDKFNIKIKVIGNSINKNKMYFYLSDCNKIINLYVRYKIIKSFFGDKIIIYDNDYYINTSV